MHTQGYSEEDLNMFHALLKEKFAKAKAELEALNASLDMTNASLARERISSLDDSSIVQEQESLELLRRRQEKYIGHLEAALLRIKDKTYGICRDTGKLIPKARLLLVPHTPTCVEAKISRDQIKQSVVTGTKARSKQKAKDDLLEEG